MSNPVVKNWYVTWENGTDGYTPPELRRKGLIGQVYGDPAAPHGDGSEICIILSTVRELQPKIVGRIITTADGKVFELGEPEPDYLKWLLESGVGYDETNPVKFVEDLKHGGLQAKRPAGGGRGRPGSN